MAVLLFAAFLRGQQVSYSAYFHLRSPGTFRIIGKSGDQYWGEKEEIRKVYNRHQSDFIVENRQFMVFDRRLNPVAGIPARQIPGTIREYLLTGQSFFDQLVLSGSLGKTTLFVNRYSAADNLPISTRLLDSFPFSAAGTRFLLVRSEDQSKILLIGFEIRGELLPRLHSILFDEAWHVLYHTILEHPYFAQPCIQDDAVSFPVEDFDNLPVKLANSGEWLMACPAMTSLNYLLFHMYDDGKSFYYQEIPVSPYYYVEDIAMSVDNQKREISIGLLSRYRNTSLKNVQVSHYSMGQNRFDFDSAYHFNSLAGGLRNQNLSNESFISIPGEGYMLLKEYGRPSDARYFQPPDIDPWDPVMLLANFSGSETGMTRLNENGYTLKKGLDGIRSVFDRGNLTMFYFPLKARDSTWSGILTTEQTTELNAPALSYLVFPVKNKIYIIYNNLIRAADDLNTATTLGINGQPTGDGVIFWKMDEMLDFQKARRISAEETAVPFKGNQRSGFALIKLAERN